MLKASGHKLKYEMPLYTVEKNHVTSLLLQI